MVSYEATDILTLDPFVLSSVICAGAVAMSTMNFIQKRKNLDTSVKAAYITEFLHSQVFMEEYQAFLYDVNCKEPRRSDTEFNEHFHSLLQNRPESPFLNKLDGVSAEINFSEQSSPWNLFAASVCRISNTMELCIKDHSIGRETLEKLEGWLKHMTRLSRNQIIRFAFSNREAQQLCDGLTKLRGALSDHKESINRNSSESLEFHHFSPRAMIIAVVQFVQLKCILICGEDVIDHSFVQKKESWEEIIGDWLSKELGYSQFYEVSQIDRNTKIPWAYIGFLPISTLSTALHSCKSHISIGPDDICNHMMQRVIYTANEISSCNGKKLCDREVRILNHLFDWTRSVDWNERFKVSRSRTRQRVFWAKKNEERYSSKWSPTFDRVVHFFGPRISKLLPNPNVPRSMGGSERARTTAF